ncbi:MAG: MFS transporter [Alphaproteobacteria bacterium]|jgi:predicted MFS family arabinose efflux permease|nr:MFS transporter [Alphaproteobacteria bacterium]
MAAIEIGGGAGSSRRLFIAALGIGQIVGYGTLYYSFPLIAGPLGEALGADKPAVYTALAVALLTAGLAAYPIGAAIDRGHGRLVMGCGAALGGLLLIAWSQVTSLTMLYLVFAGMGLAQAMTLYEPAFAVVARRLGREARQGITELTLWGGFASTVFIPLLQVLMDQFGWRTGLMVLAAFQLGICMLVYLTMIQPRLDVAGSAHHSDDDAAGPKLAGRAAVAWALRQPVFWGLFIAIVAYHGLFSAMSFHIYPMLLERGFDAATVVGALAIIGPSQVAGRLAIWTFARSQPLRAVGVATVIALPVVLLVLLFLPPSFLALAGFACLYGTVNGIMTIIRGVAIPEMLTSRAYGALNGIIAGPGTMLEALAPVGAAMLWAATGSYEAVLVGAIGAAVVVAIAFGFAAIRSAATPAV